MTKTEVHAWFRVSTNESDFQVRKRVAAALGVTPTAVNKWPERLVGGFWWVQPTLEVLTNGELVAELEDFYHDRARALPLWKVAGDKRVA